MKEIDNRVSFLYKCVHFKRFLEYLELGIRHPEKQPIWNNEDLPLSKVGIRHPE